MKCIKCGKEIDNDSKFCDGCGAAVVTEEVQPDTNASAETAAIENKDVSAEAVAPQVNSKPKSFIEKEINNYKNFKNLSSKQKLIRILVPVLILAIIIIIVTPGGSSEEVGVVKNGENYAFDITYEDFCEEMAEVCSAVTGISESDVITFCEELTPEDETVEYYSGNLKKYTIGLESSTFSSALLVLKIEVYVEPETDNVVCVTIFKANGSSTIDNFNVLANKASLILSGRIVGEMDDCLVKTVDESWQQTHYFVYEDCGMKFEQQKNTVSGGDLRRLTIYPAETFVIPQ